MMLQCGGSGGTAGDGAGDGGGGDDATIGQGDSGGGGEGGAGDDTGVVPPGDDGSNGDDSSTPPPVGASVLQFHNHANRDGQFVDDKLTATNAAKMVLDATFKPTLDGNVYAQPLYVENGPGGKGLFIAVTENNNVYGIDETGTQVWMTNVGSPASSAEGCGNIKPLGITGTPVVDLVHRAVYLDAARPGEASSTMAEHEIHALSIDTGLEVKTVSGWPVHTSELSYKGTAFNPRPQNERGALLIVNNALYVPYGGHAGDCADASGHFYKGWVVGVPLDNPKGTTAWATDSDEGGIWSVGGMVSDGTSIFASTGNAGGGQTCPQGTPTSPPPGWKQQEALIRFQAGPVWSAQTTDYFAPIDWGCLDNADKDLGGSSPVLVDLKSGSTPHLVVGLGKDGKMYLVDRTNLGGVGTDVATATIMSGEIKMAPITYTTAQGTYVVSYGSGGATGTMCPQGESGTLVAMKIVPGSPPTIAPGWCMDAGGEGSPIFTTSDTLGSDPLVWSLGAESSNQLHAWNADTGVVAFGGGGGANSVSGYRHFSTILVANGRVLAGADKTIYAFKVGP